MKKILVLCTGNSCRSQMLEAWLRYFSNGRFEVYSAGVETHGVNPDAIHFMKEVGVDMSGHTSNLVDEYLNMEFDLVITVCDHAKESCPVFPKTQRTIHRAFDDPSKVSIDEKEGSFREVRDLLKDFASEIEV